MNLMPKQLQVEEWSPGVESNHPLALTKGVLYR